MQYLEITMQILAMIFLVLSLIYMLGIIWRVEMKLDKAYKIFFVSLVFLLFSKVFDLFVENGFLSVISQISNFVFSLLMLFGVWTMRDLVKNIDEEK